MSCLFMNHEWLTLNNQSVEKKKAKQREEKTNQTKKEVKQEMF